MFTSYLAFQMEKSKQTNFQIIFSELKPDQEVLKQLFQQLAFMKGITSNRFHFQVTSQAPKKHSSIYSLERHQNSSLQFIATQKQSAKKYTSANIICIKFAHNRTTQRIIVLQQEEKVLFQLQTVDTVCQRQF